MNTIETKLYHKIEILIQRGNVYLHNKSVETIEEIVYETLSMFTADDIISISAAPSYKIINIPPNNAVLLEVLDGWEDGKPSYYLTKIKAKTLDFKGSLNLKIKYLSGMVSLPKIIDCNVVKIASKEGFVVHTNSKEVDIVNELYWLAEDLLAYTDLTGNQFDTEKAQVKLWKMNPILSKNNFPKIEKLQNNLLGQLELPMFFDKDEFSKKVNQLYNQLAKMKNG